MLPGLELVQVPRTATASQRDEPALIQLSTAAARHQRGTPQARNRPRPVPPDPSTGPNGISPLPTPLCRRRRIPPSPASTVLGHDLTSADSNAPTLRSVTDPSRCHSRTPSAGQGTTLRHRKATPPSTAPYGRYRTILDSMSTPRHTPTATTLRTLSSPNASPQPLQR